MEHYPQLKELFKQLSHFQYIQRILMWDEAVMMPVGAGESRANALGTLNRAIHKILIDKKTKRLIAQAKEEKNLSSWDIANLALMEKKYNRAACVPLKLTAEATKMSIMCEQAWRRLRPTNNWHEFYPFLERTFQLSKEISKRQAQALDLNLYDTVIDPYVPGFNQTEIDAIFATLKRTLPSLVQEIIIKKQSNNIQLPIGPFAIEQQKNLGLIVMKALGFDFEHGRLDVSHHPFCSGAPCDVRITTRYLTDQFLSSLIAIFHETGHALYEQGLPREWIDQPVGRMESMAMHESQSLLIEMQICRSKAFIDYLTPLVRSHFGEQSAFTAENLYRVTTKVQPGLIRVDADEVTYPLHIILRYEIEKALFSGEIMIKDLPQVWDELIEKYLGLSTKGNYKDGVMQDSHWAAGKFGYFPAYTLGRLIAAQLFASYENSYPAYREDIKEGNFKPLVNWLQHNIYDYASSLPTQDLLHHVTGKYLDASYFIDHIRQRYL